MAAGKKNKVKFGLNKVHFAMCHIDDDGNATYDTPVRIPGGVSLSVNPSGEPENFYADNRVFYVINNNSGYEGIWSWHCCRWNFAKTCWARFWIRRECWWRRTMQS